MSKLKKVLLMSTTYALVVALAIGGTLAWLTDRDSKANVFTVGDVSIELNEDFEQGSALIPGVDIKKEATITNTGDNDAWVWLTVLLPVEMGPYTAPDNMSASNNVVHWNYPKESAANITVDFNSTPVKVDTNGDGVTESYYQTNLLWNNVLEADDTTGVMLSKVYMDTRVDIDPDGNMYWVVDGVTTDLNWNVNEKGNPVIHVSAYAIQAENFADVHAAYAAYQTQWGDNGAEYDDPNVTVVTPKTIDEIDFSQEGMIFSLRGNYSALSIPQLGEGSVISFDNATVGALSLADDTVLSGTAVIDSVKLDRNDTESVVLTIADGDFDIAGELGVRNTDGKSVLNIENSHVEFGTIFVGQHTQNQPAALAEFNVINSFLSGEENSLGSTISVWGRSGVKATIYDSEIYTYSRGWHQSEDANDNSITIQGATSIDVDIQRSNMHLYGARSIINVRQYGSEATTVTTNIDESLIWVVTKSSHGENTIPVWGFDEETINDTILLFTKNVHQSTPAVFKSFVYGNPVIHGDYHVTTQCQWDAPIALADGQTVTFASDADVSIYDGAGNVEFVKTGSAKVVVEDGAVVENISGIN